MEKTEAVNRLKKAGYQVQFDSSVVTVLLEKNKNISQEIKKIRVYLQEIGYHASFGVKQVKNDSIPEKKDDIEPKIEKSSEKEEKSVKEEIIEVGEQFSLEDFGIN